MSPAIGMQRQEPPLGIEGEPRRALEVAGVHGAWNSSV